MTPVLTHQPHEEADCDECLGTDCSCECHPFNALAAMPARVRTPEPLVLPARYIGPVNPSRDLPLPPPEARAVLGAMRLEARRRPWVGVLLALLVMAGIGLLLLFVGWVGSVVP